MNDPQPEGHMASHLGRRKFLATLGGAAAWPLAARAQQPTMPVIGWLGPVSPPDEVVSSFRRGLAEAGYVEGQNVASEYRSAEGNYDRLPTLAAELVRRQVALIFASTPPAVLAAKAATSIIPIVFQMGGDPVEMGVVASFNRPGANITGISHFSDALERKRLEVLRQLVPKADTIAMLVNPTFSNVERQLRDAREAARALGIQLRVMNASSERELDMALETLARERVGGLLVAADGFFFSRRNQLAALAARHALPAIFSLREYAVAGGLMAYGSSIRDSYRLAGGCSGRILKGEKPANIPIQQTVK